MTTVLRTEKLSKIYHYRTENQFQALHEIDFHVEQGDFIAIMGPSGSGKSTLLNCISTMDEPTFGKLFIMEKNVRAMGENEKGRFRFHHLGFIFQNYQLLDTHTLFENIALPLSLAKKTNQEIYQQVLTMAKKLEIEAYLHQYPSQCSGGQQQRAAIARALINQPDLVVADEPTGNLDSSNAKIILNHLVQLNQEGTTIVLVTHDPFIASYTKQVLYLVDGKIQQQIDRHQQDQPTFLQQIQTLASDQNRGLL